MMKPGDLYTVPPFVKDSRFEVAQLRLQIAKLNSEIKTIELEECKTLEELEAWENKYENKTKETNEHIKN